MARPITRINRELKNKVNFLVDFSLFLIYNISMK